MYGPQWMQSTGGLAVAALLALGCERPASEERARLAELEAQGQQLNAATDALEERFMGNQAAVELWSEMARRHKQVSAIAVTNADQHFNGMVRYFEYQQEKSRGLRRHREEPAATALAPAIPTGGYVSLASGQQAGN